MQKLIYLLLLLSVKGISQASDLAILEQTALNLNEIETVRYRSHFAATEAGIAYLERIDSVYFDFGPEPTAITPRYYLKNSEAELIYDGKRHIQSWPEKRLILTNENPPANNPLLLTLFPIRVLLPKMLMNDNVVFTRKNDTLINRQGHYIFDIIYKNGAIDWENLKLKYYQGTNSKYILTIDKSSLLPSMLTMENGPSGTISRTYENYDFEYTPDKELWTGSLFPSEYAKTTFAEYYSNIDFKSKATALGDTNSPSVKKAFDTWKLPDLENNSMIDFKDLRGNLILLEFWFKNCGPCIQAVPGLNAIQEKYKNRTFKLYGIEFQENFPQENLQYYVSKVKMDYPILYKGKNMAANYEVSGAPTFMIINKAGEIIYNQSGYNENEILKLIEENL